MIANAQIDVPGPITGEDPLQSIGGMVSFGFQLVLIIAGLYAFFQIVMAGYGMISSGGDKGHLEQARGKIIWAFIGLIIVLASWGMIILVEELLGICLGFSCPVNLGIE